VIVHSLYGPLKSRAVYMKKAYANVPLTYFKRFPKPFANEIIVNSDGYPKYRRRRTVNGVNVVTIPTYQVIAASGKEVVQG
jgi:hypothetical protein